MTTMATVFDFERSRFVQMPALELRGMVNVPVEGFEGGVWVKGFTHDFGQGREALADPLGEMANEMCAAGLEALDYSFGFPKLMYLGFIHDMDARAIVDILGPDIGVTTTVEVDEHDDEETMVRFPREALPIVIARWRRFAETLDLDRFTPLPEAE